MKRFAVIFRILRHSAWVAALAVVVAPGLGYSEERARGGEGLDPGKRLTQYVFDSWSQDDGLRSARILDIAQTADGYLWIATFSGLTRFDGIRFSNFDPRSAPAFTSSEIYALEPRADGGLWIGSADGSILLRSGATFSRIREPDPGRRNGIFSLHEDRTGRLWAWSERDGLLRYAFVDGRLRSLPLPPSMESVSVPMPVVVRDAFFEDEEGTLWFASQGNGVYAIRENTLRIFTTADGLNDDFVQSVAGTHDGTIWIASDRGLNRRRGGRIEDATEPLGLHGTPIPSLHVDRAGSLWIGEQLVYRHGRGGTEQFTALEFFPDVAFLEDMEGSLWLGSVMGPLVRFSSGIMTTVSVEEGLSGDSVHSVHEDRAGNVWIGTFQAGLNRISSAGIEHYTEADGLPSSRVWSIRESSRQDDRIWIGTDGGLVRHEDGRFEVFTTADGLASNRIRVVYPDPDGSGTLWIGTIDAGLDRWRDGVVSHWSVQDGLSHDNIRWLQKDRTGALWIGTENGINLLRDGELTTVDALPTITRTRCAYEDDDGTLWIGSSGGGLARHTKGRFTYYTTSDGLQTNDVWGIAEDDRANLWMSGPDGIARVAKDQFDAYDSGSIEVLRVDVYGNRDGMKNSGGTAGGFPNAWTGADGRLWFTTTSGVVAIAANQEPRFDVPAAVIESIAFDEESVPPVDEVAIPAGTRQVTLRYTAPSLTAPERLGFRHRLVGYDDEWTDSNGGRVVRFARLSPRSYRFEVVPYDREGGSHGEPTTLSFTLLPLWWQTPWFRGASVAAVLALIASVVYVIMRHRAQQRGLIQERRDEFARLGRLAAMGEFTTTLSHEFKQPLGAIRANAEAAKRFVRSGTPDLGEIESILDDIIRDDERATDLVDRIRALVKKRPFSLERIDLNDAIKNVLQLTRPDAARRQVTLEFRGDEGLPSIMGDRIQLEQVLLNLIFNGFDSVADVTRRRVEVSGKPADGEFVQVSVRDNGTGVQGRDLDQLFESFYTTKSTGLGLGLAISRSIVEAHDGKIWATENPDRGLTVHFTIPIATRTPP